MGGQIIVGTSGWSYDAWKHDFYEGIPRRRWLEHAASRVTGLEVNGTFYRLQQPATFRDWVARTPREFVFTAKGHRFVTHSKKLLDPDEPVVRTRDSMRALESKLAAVVWQLPASLARDDARLATFASTLRRRWRKVRHVIEFRDSSWFCDEVAGLMAEHGLVVCISDAATWPRWDAVTTDLVYVRLHGHTRTYRSAYSDQSITEWARRVAAWCEAGRTVHVYFDNDAEGHAPHDAVKLIERLRGQP